MNAVQGSASVVEDLVGALRMVGCIREDDLQKHADAILDQMQQDEGLVATFCHQSDGE